MSDADGARGTLPPIGQQPLSAFTWRDHSRFVEVAPVESGWLVLWGWHRDMGRTRVLTGNRTYADLDGARRRVADAVFELTADAGLVGEALVQFDRTPFSNRSARSLVDRREREGSPELR
jgi:hypothetical protein